MYCENSTILKDTESSLKSKGKSQCFCDSNNLDYYHEIEEFKSRLKDSHNNSNRLEIELSDIKERFKKDICKLNDEVLRQKEKYERLHESHKRISRLNHELEERILNIIDQFNNEKLKIDQSFKEVLSKYEASQTFISDLQIDCERYRNDCIIAVQLLQNNPSSFLTRHIETLPNYLKSRLNHWQKDIEISRSFNRSNPNFADSQSNSQNPCNTYIPISTFPPTAMLFSDNSVDKKPESLHNHICAGVLAQVLHPDKVDGRQKSISDSKLTIELVCKQCGSVTEYRDVSCQTSPRSVESNASQKTTKNNQNLIFDV